MVAKRLLALPLLLVGALVFTGCSGAGSAVVPTPTPTCEPSIPEAISAYDLWLEAGHTGTVEDFLDSLVGEKGEDGYVGYYGKSGPQGPTGVAGKSAYQVWLDEGNAGSVDVFLESLVGPAGVAGLDGLSAYDLWLELGNTGTVSEFLASLRGVDGICTVGSTGPQGELGPTGPAGPAGATGPQGPAGPALSPVEVSYVLGGGTTGDGAQPPTFNGNPMFYGSYVVTGDLVFYNVKVVMTNITYFGRGQYYVTLPFDSKHPHSSSNGRVTDFSSGRNYSLHGTTSAGSDQLLLTYDSGAQQIPFDYNSPVGLTTTDTFFISGTYIKE